MPNEPGVGEASTDPDSIPQTSFPGARRWTATWMAPQLNRQWSHCRLPPLCQGPTRPSRSARPRHSASGGDLAPCLPFPISRGQKHSRSGGTDDSALPVLSQGCGDGPAVCVTSSAGTDSVQPPSLPAVTGVLPAWPGADSGKLWEVSVRHVLQGVEGKSWKSRAQ